MKKIIIFDFNRTLYNPETQKLYPHVKFILATLCQKGYTLFLISFGGQERRDQIASCGIEKYFEKIVMTREKSVENFSAILDASVNRKTSFVVGDQLEAEITIGKKLGMQTILVKWGEQISKGKKIQDMKTDKTDEADMVISDLEWLLRIIP